MEFVKVFPNLEFETHPFQHAILPHFLNDEALHALLKTLQQEEFLEKNSDLFTFFQTNDLTTSENSMLKQTHAFLEGPMRDWLKHAGITTTHADMHATLYEDTHYLLPHDDRLENRKIAYLLYLSSLGKDEGGQLCLYNSKDSRPTTIAKKILPQANTLILFQVSAVSFHEVKEVLGKNQRITLGGWFHA